MTDKTALATFEIELRPDANREELGKLSGALLALAAATPSIGAIRASTWSNEDGTVLAVYGFDSMSALQEFVAHPQHRAAMKRANEFFVSIRTQIATVEKQSERTLGG